MRILSVEIKDDYVFTFIFSSPKFTKLLVDDKRPSAK
jgi:hypothetical protein